MSDINNKHLPSDIDSLTRKDLVEIYHIHAEEYQRLLDENERLLNAVGLWKEENEQLKEQLATVKLDVIDSVNELYGIMSSTMKPMSMSECLDQIEQELKDQGE